MYLDIAVIVMLLTLVLGPVVAVRMPTRQTRRRMRLTHEVSPGFINFPEERSW